MADQYKRKPNGQFDKVFALQKGKDSVPTSKPSIPVMGTTDYKAAQAADLEALYARFGKPNQPGREPNTVEALTGGSGAAEVIEFDKITYQPVAILKGVYTEYLASVDKLDPEDLDDMTGPYDWGALENSIRSEGVKEPIEIGVDEDGERYIINGCHRAYLAYNMKLDNIPVVYRRS
jgi:ParB-like nuclease domain